MLLRLKTRKKEEYDAVCFTKMLKKKKKASKLANLLKKRVWTIKIKETLAREHTMDDES